MQTGTQSHPDDFDRYVSEGRRDDWLRLEHQRRLRHEEMVNPDQEMVWSIAIECSHGFDLVWDALEIARFYGRNWDEHGTGGSEANQHAGDRNGTSGV